jgi:hypothetical protein
MSQFINKKEDIQKEDTIKEEEDKQKFIPIIKINNLTSKNVIITKLKFDKNKKPSAIFLNIDNKKSYSFGFETSIFTVTFSPSYFGEQNKEKHVPEDQRNYSMVLRPNGGMMENAEQTETTMKFLEELKNLSIDYGIENSNMNIFKRKFDPSQREMMVETSYNWPFKPRAQPDGTFYPVSVTVKIPKIKNTNIPDILFFTDKSKLPIEITSWEDLKERLPPGIKCILILKPILSFVNKQMCFTLRLLQIMVFTNDKITMPKEYAFSFNISNEMEKLQLNNTKEDIKDSSKNDDFGVVINDSEDNDSDIEVDVDDN